MSTQRNPWSISKTMGWQKRVVVGLSGILWGRWCTLSWSFGDKEATSWATGLWVGVVSFSILTSLAWPRNLMWQLLKCKTVECEYEGLAPPGLGSELKKPLTFQGISIDFHHERYIDSIQDKHSRIASFESSSSQFGDILAQRHGVLSNSLWKLLERAWMGGKA